MKLLSQLKKDMDFNLNLYSLIEVLKQISIVQYRILEKKIKVFDDVFSALGDIFVLLQSSKIEHPLLQTAGRQPAVIAITSDTGLLGGLNMGVMAQAVKEAQKNQAKLIIIGEKGQMYAQESGLPFVIFKGVKDDTRLAQAQELRDYVFEEELNSRLGDLKIVYPTALSLVSQQIKTLQIFPFSKPEQFKEQPAEFFGSDILMESAIGDILQYWIYLYIGKKFFQIFGLARLAELSARFSHLESSKTKIEQLNKELRLQYFKQRHELIDKNMRELFAARLVFK